MGYFKNLQVPHYRKTRRRLETAGDPQVGRHPAMVSDVSERDSKAGDPMLVIEYEVTEGPDEGKRARQFFLLERSYGQESLLKTLDRLGVECDDEGGFDRTSLIGLAVTIDVVPSKKDPTMVNVKSAWRPTPPAGPATDARL